MFSSGDTAELSLDLPCRSACAVRADRTESRFLVGSCATNDNHHYVHVVRFHQERNDLILDAQLIYNNGPIEVICSSPDDPTLLCIANSSSSPMLSLCKIPDEAVLATHTTDSEDNTTTINLSMEQIISIPTNNNDIVADIGWGDDSIVTGGELLFVTRSGYLTQFDLASNRAIRTIPNVCESKTLRAGWCPRIAWDPHANGNAVAVTTGKRVQLLDWRVDTSIPTGTVDSFVAHRPAVTAVDYNPNKPYLLATAGQDALIKFWDLRLTNKPLLVARGGHSHWISSLHYNPFHDQLVLSSGTDTVANLWRMSTISSAPLLTMNDDDPDVSSSGSSSNNNNNNTNKNDDEDDTASETAGPNARIARHEQVEGIYNSCWSAADAWVYLTLGYDGKVQCHSVPSKEKYKILL